MSTTTYTNGHIAGEKGRSLALEVQDTFLSSDDPDAHAHWVEEALHDLMATPRHDRAIAAFTRELLPVLTRGMAVEFGLCDMEGGHGLHTLYAHPDVGGNLTYDDNAKRLIAWNGHEESFGTATIGPLGLRELGKKLLALAAELEGAEHEHS